MKYFLLMFYCFILLSLNPLMSQISIVTQPKSVSNCLNSMNNSMEFVANVNLITLDYYTTWFRDGVRFAGPFMNEGRFNFSGFDFKTSGVFSAQVYTVAKGAGVNGVQTANVATNSFLVNVLSNTIITKAPKTQMISIGETASFYVEAHTFGYVGGANNQNILVEWWKGNTRLTDNNKYAGTKSSLLTISNVMASDLSNDYRVVLKGQCGNDTSVVFGVAPLPTINISQQPVFASGCFGTQLSFSTDASISSNDTLTYQWYADGAMLVDGARISGSKTNNLLFTATIKNGNIWCMVSTKNNTLNSKTVEVAYNTFYIPTINSHTMDMNAEAGKGLSISVDAQGDGNLSYEWTKDGIIMDTVKTNKFIKLSASASDAGVYQIKVTNLCGSVSTATITISVTSAISLSIEDDSNQLGLIQNYPNPVVDNTKLVFKNNFATNVKLVLSTITGNVIYSQDLGEFNAGLNTFDLNISDFNLTSGIYFVNLISNEFNSTKQLNVIR